MLVDANENFQKDRPLMDELNANPDAVRVLLIGEIRELNGHHPEYMTLNDYRQQEVADILMFVLSLAESLQIDLREKQILKLSEAVYRSYGIRPVAIGQPLALAKDFDEHAAEQYEGMKRGLAERANRLEMTELTKKHKVEIRAILEGIVSDCFALYALLQVNPIRATLEKIMRNILKYQPKYFQITDDIREMRDQPEYYLKVRQVYAARRQLSVAAFDGEKDPVTKQRPETGSRDFYQGDAPMIEYFKNQGGLR